MNRSAQISDSSPDNLDRAADAASVASRLLSRLGGPSRMTLGVELPLDNDFAYPRKTTGIPDIEKHHERAALADALGFRAI